MFQVYPVGTIAFLLGFYDKFISSLDDLLRGNWDSKKNALSFLIKLFIGWIVGFLLSATILSNIFNTQIYALCSLFLGFIIFAIPIVIKEEKEFLKNKYVNIIFTVLGIALVVIISSFNTSNATSINLSELNLFTIVYVFFCAMIAISAMILPGISGSTLLLIFGLYMPIISRIKQLLTFDFSPIPILIVFGLGIITGILLFVRLIRKCLEKYRSKTIYMILGMMIGSIYSIIIGPTTLEVPQSAMNFSTFNIFAFIIGGVIILGLEILKSNFNKYNKNM